MEEASSVAAFTTWCQRSADPFVGGWAKRRFCRAVEFDWGARAVIRWTDSGANACAGHARAAQREGVGRIQKINISSADPDSRPCDWLAGNVRKKRRPPLA